MSPSGTPRDLPGPTALQILLTLAEQNLHGYGIKRDVEARTGGSMVLRPGTLYEAIHRMEADGWIEEIAGDGGRRRTYRITGGGRRVLAEELERLDAIVRHARAADLLPGGGG